MFDATHVPEPVEEPESTAPGENRPRPIGFLPSPPPCRPPWWARGGHAQTLLGHWLASPAAELPWEILNVKLADGDALRIRLVRGRSGRVVTLFHGLGGSADRDYMLRAAARFFAAGDSVIAVNHRGAGDGRGLARKPYHSGATTDLAAVFQVGRGLFPDHWHLAIGYSLSGNILLLLLGQDAKEPVPKPPRAALGAPGGGSQGRRGEHSGFTRSEPDAAGCRPPPQPEGTMPAGRSSASGPLNDEPHRPAGPSLRSIPAGIVAAHEGFGTGSWAHPDAAIAVNPPADLDHCSRLLGRGLNRLYDLRFVHLLREELRHRWELGLLDAPVAIPAAATLRDFDELYTAKAAGFWDRSQYYARCACGPHLGRVRIPTVILSAEDDPFAPAADLLRCPLSPRIHLHIEPHGGHMGYLTRDLPDRRWLEPTLLHFAGALFKLQSNKC